MTDTVTCLRCSNIRPRGQACRVCRKIRVTTHGKSGSPTYESWAHMKSRCLNPDDDNYHRYGGRGITIDPRWAKFKNFLADMGERPEGTTLDRKDNDRGYSKRNCRWATPEQQMNNTRRNVRVQYQDSSYTISQLARLAGHTRTTVAYRIKAGIGIDETIHRQWKKQTPRTHCLRGHELTADNTYVRNDGRRRCRLCNQARDRGYKAKIRKVKREEKINERLRLEG